MIGSQKRGSVQRSVAILVIYLMLAWPMVSALEISEVQVSEIGENGVVISWQTDEAADSFVEYGQNRDSLTVQGDANKVTDHEIALESLQGDSAYIYGVESGGVRDDKSGEYYSFMTLAPDTTAPQIVIDIPSYVQGNRLTLEGIAEGRVELFVNGVLITQTTADEQGNFKFERVAIPDNAESLVEIRATDGAGNSVSEAGRVISDMHSPVIVLTAVDELVVKKTIEVAGRVDEPVSIEVFVGNDSAGEANGTVFNISVSLEEGANTIRVVARDGAGWVVEESFAVVASTRRPTVSFTLEGGREYFENRAVTKITGEANPGANAYLYVWENGIDDQRRDYTSKAVMRESVGNDGTFSFKDVAFPATGFLRPGRILPSSASLNQFGVKEVPPGLEDITVSPLSQLARDTRRSFDVVIIVEDGLGRTAFSKQTINVNTCSSGEQDFRILDQIQFQAPFKLDPELMRQGRESIQAVFNLSYHGDGATFVDERSGQPRSAYKVNSVEFRKACTAEMSEQDEFKYGCKLLPPRLNKQASPDGNAYYVTGGLLATDQFEDRDKDFWRDFSKRRLKLPLRIVVNYQERKADGSFTTTKTQTSCQDLSYFVDIPLESNEFVPDILADEGVQGLNWTINQIETIKPYLETAMLVAGISCMGSIAFKMITRFYRNFMAKFEQYTTRLNKDDKKCPNEVAQQKLFMDSTIESWNNIRDNPGGANVPSAEELAKRKLSDKCPQTAGAWKAESALDKAYRWSCDRFLCRAVPAGWTQYYDREEVQRVEDSQTACSASTQCAYLTKIENCQEELKKSATVGELSRINQGAFTCYRDSQGVYYYASNNDNLALETRIDKVQVLRPVNDLVKPGQRAQDKLVAYFENPNSAPCVAIDRSCDQVCKDRSKGEADTEGYKLENFKEAATGGACYKYNTKAGQYQNVKGEAISSQQDDDGQRALTRYRVGYTKDCFVDTQTNDLYQCVCKAGEEVEGAQSASGSSWRVAIKTPSGKEGTGNAEEWSYRQAAVYRESRHTSGTLYPNWRYYSGRDFSGAFGTDYALDNINDDTPNEQNGRADKSTTKIDPHTQTIGTFQSMCLPGIYARLTKLQSVLIGLRDCIVQAKTTGFTDAGLCKSIFTQYVCGLVYKTIAYLGSSCSPLSIDDYSDKENSGFAAFFNAGFQSIDQTISSSIDEVSEDYGNAKLDEFFATGAQGLTESICLAAFGYDFPIGADFIMDAAHSFQTQTDVVFPLAQRELSTFDPHKGTAVFNYHLGGAILPGCKIRSHKTELVCIDENDLGNPNVDQDCGGEGCDCLRRQGKSAFEGERRHLVAGGSGVGSLQQNNLFDMPIQSPQKVSTKFRYDHVRVELTVDRNQDPTQCFDEGIRRENGGVFYFPISDVSGPGQASCSASVATGQYACPEFTNFFTGGSTYFAAPFLRCLDDVSGTYVKCDTPNLFYKDGPEVVIQPHIFSGGEGVCLKVSEKNGKIRDKGPFPLPENLNGQITQTISLGPVTPDMIAGGNLGTVTVSSKNNKACGGHQNGEVEVIGGEGSTTREVKIGYIKTGEKYIVQIKSNGVGIVTANEYGLKDDKNTITFNGKDELSLSEVNGIVFKVSDFIFTKVLNEKATESGECTFVTRPAGKSRSSGIGTLDLTLELLKPSLGGNCLGASVRLPDGSFGKSIHSEKVRVQSERVESTQVRGLHELFMRGDYNGVVSLGGQILNQNLRSLEEAIAYYYIVAAFIMKGEGVDANLIAIKGFIRKFFDLTKPFGEDVVKTGEYRKVDAYMCSVYVRVAKEDENFKISQENLIGNFNLTEYCESIIGWRF